MSANRSRPTLSLAATTALLLLLTGCTATAGAAPQVPHSTAAATPTATPPGAVSPAAQPLPAARMICTQETQANIAKILSIAHPEAPVSHWANQLYTCTYRMPGGTLTLSVQQSADDAKAKAYFDAQQKAAPAAQTVEGLPSLGLPAYLTPDGQASFVKDNMTLLVDGSRLPPAGPGQPSRTHRAYQIATAILACWSG